MNRFEALLLAIDLNPGNGGPISRARFKVRHSQVGRGLVLVPAA